MEWSLILFGPMNTVFEAINIQEHSEYNTNLISHKCILGAQKSSDTTKKRQDSLGNFWFYFINVTVQIIVMTQACICGLSQQRPCFGGSSKSQDQKLMDIL